MKVPGPTEIFTIWGSGKRTENPKEIWLRRPVEFDYRTSTVLGKQTLEGTNKSLCAPGPRRKEQWPLKTLSQTCLWVFRRLWQRHRSTVAATGSGTLNTKVLAWVLLKEAIKDCITPIIPIIVWSQAKQHKVNTAPPTNRKGIKDLLSIAPPIRTRFRFPRVSHSHQEVSTSLLSLSIRGKTVKTTVTVN